MGRHSTIPATFESRKIISIKKLKEWSYLNPNSIKNGDLNWSRNGNNIGGISIEVNTLHNYIELSYTFQETQNIKYKIELVQTPSNLGKGYFYLFRCPQTQRLCRKLYFIGGYFFHRTFRKGIFYEKQIYSYKYRLLNRMFDAEEIETTLYKKYFKTHYRGKETKRYSRIMKQIKECENMPYRLLDLL